jgi:AraC-like DNA-binding protein
MFNIRAKHIEQDLAAVHAAYGDVVEGLTFDFADQDTGGILATGGCLGPLGIMLTSYEITAGYATLPGDDFLKFEQARNGSIVQVQGASELISRNGTTVLTGPGLNRMAFQPDGRAVRSMSANLSVTVLQELLDKSEEPIVLGKVTQSGNGSRPASEAQLSGLVQHLLEHFQEYAASPRRGELAEALLMECYSAYLRDTGYIRGVEVAGLRPDTRGVRGNARIVARAEAFMRSHYQLPLTMADVAAHAGVSLRKLQSVFRERRNSTPSMFLNETRLAQARQRLLHPESSDSVTSAALESGIFHLGRFSRAYLARYGEFPSETLARSKR